MMQSGSPPTSSRGTPSRRGRSPKSVPHSVAQASDALSTEFSDKQPSTFITCLSIPVEGAVPIKPQEDSPSSPQTRMSHQGTSGSAKRAPRKSKTNALAALQNHASDFNNDEGGSQDASDDFFGANSPISVSPSLDLSSVKTSSPRNQPTRSTPRPFGLQDCPVFYPTSDEFKDPMAYIDSISRRVVNHGICKVVPPVGWKMPFVTNTEVCMIPQNFYDFFEPSDLTLPFISDRPFVSRLDYSASTPSRQRLVQRSTFWSSCTASTSSKAIHVSLCPRSITSHSIFGFCGRRYRNWGVTRLCVPCHHLFVH